MESTQEILTPKNRFRSLGLKRSIQRTTAIKTPQSDARICYKSLQGNIEADPSTPLSQIPLKTSAYTTTKCVPYRMSLSRRVRDRYKKKKLEFAVSTQEAEADSLQEDAQPTSSRGKELPTALLEEIETNQTLINTHQNHQAKVKELKAVISIWKETFKASLEELSLKIQPKMEAGDLIARLGIQPEMIEYT